jgi:hypothetical protein
MVAKKRTMSMFYDIKEIDAVECCFCKKDIQETRNDPVDITIVLHEEMAQKDVAAQGFYAHVQCLYEKLHEDVRGYLLKKREKTLN